MQRVMIEESTRHKWVKVYFSRAVIAMSIKPCIVIILEILSKNALWPGALDLDFVLE